MKNQSIDFEARKELIKSLQGGKEITVNGNEYTFHSVDNPYFPHFVTLKGADGATKTLPIDNVGESIRASIGDVLKPESPRSFSAYKKHSGELDSTTYNAVMNCRISQDDLRVAMETLGKLGLLPDQTTVNMAAQLIVGLKGDGRTQDSMWLMTEAMLLQGRF